MAIRTQVAFAITPEWVLYHPTLSDRAIRLYGVMMRHADNDTHRCYPSRRRLAECMHCSVNTVDRALAELIDAGAIVSSPRERENGSQTSNDYTMTILHTPTPISGEGGSPISGAPPSLNSGAPITRTSTNIEPVELDSVASQRAWPDPEFQPVEVTEEVEPSPPIPAAPSPGYEEWKWVCDQLFWDPKVGTPLGIKKVKEMAREGVSLEDMRSCAIWLMQDPFWSEKGVDIKLVQSQMAKFKNRKEKPRSRTLQQEYEETVRDLKEAFGDN